MPKQRHPPWRHDPTTTASGKNGAVHYSPELNPDEGINGGLKQAVTGKEPARSRAQLKRAAIGHMRKLTKLPDRVRSFFGNKTFRYAA